MILLSNEVLSSLLLIGISLNAVLNDIVVKFLIFQGFDSIAVTGLRIFFSFLIATTIGFIKYDFKVFNGIFQWRHWVRNFITIIALLAVIHGLKYCQISQIDLITYLIPGFISLISTIFFKEKFNIINFILVLICIGVFLNTTSLSNTLPLILAAFLFGLGEMWIKHKMHKDYLLSMTISLGLMGSLSLSYFFIPYLLKMNFYQLILSILMGIGDITILGLITWKAKIGSSNDFLPLRYTSVLFAVTADILFFKNYNINYLMISVIVGSSILSLLFNKNN